MGDLRSGLESAGRVQGFSILFGHKSACHVFEITTSSILREVQALKLVTLRHPLSHIPLV